MREALRRSGKAAVAKVAMRRREQLLLVRVYKDVLVMQQVHWPDEVNSPARVAPSDRVTHTPGGTRAIGRATDLREGVRCRGDAREGCTATGRGYCSWVQFSR